MSEIKHFILTRFNVATPGRWEEIRLRPHWLEKRYDLFKDFCLPGVASQTRKDFEWIIFFDEQTPADYMERIRKLQSVFPFRIIQTPLFEMKDLCKQLVQERAGADWLLTTRLDSDDILATDFVENLRRDLKPDTHHNLNFPNGLILSIKSDSLCLYRDRDMSSPFASLMEPFNDNVQTIWEKQHRYIDEMAPITQGSEQPMWLQVVHGDNISNHVRGVRIPLKLYADRFPYLKTLSIAQNEGAEIFFENLTMTPVRFAKETSRNIAKKLLNRR